MNSENIEFITTDGILWKAPDCYFAKPGSKVSLKDDCVYFEYNNEISKLDISEIRKRHLVKIDTRELLEQYIAEHLKDSAKKRDKDAIYEKDFACIKDNIEKGFVEINLKEVEKSSIERLIKYGFTVNFRNNIVSWDLDKYKKEYLFCDAFLISYKLKQDGEYIQAYIGISKEYKDAGFDFKTIYQTLNQNKIIKFVGDIKIKSDPKIDIYFTERLPFHPMIRVKYIAPDGISFINFVVSNMLDNRTGNLIKTIIIILK